MQEVALVARIVLGTLLLLSAVAKMRAFPALVKSIQQYGMELIGSELARIVARLLPPFEFILSLLLVTGIWLKAAAITATGLLLTFTVLMAANLTLGRRFPCNCFGARSADIGVGSLSRNTVLIAAGILLTAVSPWSTFSAGLLQINIQLLSGLDVIALLTAGVSMCAILLVVGEVDVLFHNPKAK